MKLLLFGLPWKDINSRKVLIVRCGEYQPQQTEPEIKFVIQEHNKLLDFNNYFYLFV